MPDYTTQGQINGAVGSAAGRSQEQYPEQRRFANPTYDRADIAIQSGLGTIQSGLGTKLSADRHKSDLEIATDHLTQAIELLNARAIAMQEKLRTAGLLNNSENGPGEVLSGAMPGVSTPYANHLIQLAEKANETSRMIQITTNLLGV